MPDTGSTLETILRHRLIAVLRLDSAQRAIEIAEAIVAGGITTIEVTLTTPGALGVLAELAGRDGLLVGAGTVLSARDADAAFAAGARFYASPVLDPALIALAHDAGAIAMPGAFTPTEMVAADRAGADLIKIFPMPPDPAAYIRTLRGPLPGLRLAPSGGVTAQTAAALLQAGASALNVGTWLTHNPGGILAPAATIRARASQLLEAIAPHQ